MKRILMLSGGESSWAAGKLEVQRYGSDDLVALFTDTKEEDPETYDFLRRAAENIGIPLHIAADGRGIWEVFKAERMIGNTRADVCSKMLKRKVADRWLAEHCAAGDTVLLGYHVEEVQRYEKARGRYNASGYGCRAPLCERPWLPAGEISRWARAEGLPRQSLYAEGFPHANCGGFCVKAGQAHFKLLLRVRPETYARHEAEEESLRQHLGKDVAILRDRRGGVTRPLTLRQFRERVEGGGECDLFDWGGCGCFTEPLDSDD